MPPAPEAVLAIDPRSGEALGSYPENTPADIAPLVEAALAAARDPRLQDPARISAALNGAAANLRAAGDELRPLVQAESGLPEVRVAGELERTCVQLELFAEVVEKGDHLEVIIDPADPDARPVPRPDLRRMLVPLGPVAVFGASNFPLAFGVAGGDTASALAAGCPVIAKGHPSQPGTNVLVSECVARAVDEAGLPAGTWATLQGASIELGEALVDAPGIAAVGFTGSTRGGRALFDRAARRPRPIPVYAEMGSVNPSVLTVAALRARGESIRDQLVTSVTFAAGQLCTKPGVVFVPTGQEGDALVTSLVEALDAMEPAVLLNDRLREGFMAGLGVLGSHEGVQQLTGPRGAGPAGFQHAPTAFTIRAAAVAAAPEVREECFGPAVLLARYEDEDELLGALASFDGQLSASVFAEPSHDAELISEVATVLTERVGRIAFDAFTTGVAVAWATHHGGPYPSTTTPDHTSVGLTATRRFMRPVCWQNAPLDVLPWPLRNENPAGLWRRIDGELTTRAM